MIPIKAVYIGFAILVIVALSRARRTPPQLAAVASLYIGALVFLPAVDYVGVAPEVIVPVWYIGVLVPVPFMWLNKAWIAALAAIALAVMSNPGRLREFRPSLIDLPIVLFCLWPLAQAPFAPGETSPHPVVTTLLLFGCWSLPWFLGRIFLHGRDGRLVIADALIAFTLLLLPIAMFEGVSALRIHDLLFGPHPFSRDGVERYVGYRPMAFFEHGNQYGIWVSCAALAGWWRARYAPRGDNRAVRWVIALTLLGMAVASQSVGALVLLAFALVGLELAPWLARHRWLPRAAIAGALLSVAALGVTLYAAREAGRELPIVAQAEAVLYEAGRGSLQWRVARALDAVPRLREHLVLGEGRWDWYAGGPMRPWDLVLMLVGQFGLVGVGLLVATVIGALAPPRGPRPPGTGSTRYLAITLILIAGADALLNSFVFLPALALLGSLPAPAASRSKALPDATESAQADTTPAWARSG